MTVLTDDLERTILESVRQGTPAGTAARAAGINPATIARWMAIAEGAEYWPGTTSQVDEALRSRIVRFAEALERAKAESRSVLVGALWHNATTKNLKSGWYDTQAADKLLSKSADHRSEWYENKQLQVTSQTTVTHEVQAVQGMTHTELLDVVPAEFRELVEQPALPDHGQTEGADPSPSQTDRHPQG